MSNQTFGMSGSDMFDSIQATQGGVPHLLQYLWDAYVEHLGEEIEKLKAAGKPHVTLEQAKLRAPATHFLPWASAYLAEHRATQTFFIDENVGLLLTNGKTVAVSPGVEVRGTMQETHAVAVMEGKGQKGNEGVVTTQHMRI